MRDYFSGSTAAQCGKPTAFRKTSIIDLPEAEPPAEIGLRSIGKPKAYLTGLRQSRLTLARLAIPTSTTRYRRWF